jgi:hypothetical protein
MKPLWNMITALAFVVEAKVPEPGEKQGAKVKLSLAMLMKTSCEDFKGRDYEQRPSRGLTTSVWLPLLR